MEILKIHIRYGLLFMLAWSATIPWTGCSSDHSNVSSIAKKSIDDAVYIEFEEVADLSPEQYIHNPDSFLQAFHLAPKDAYQHEIYSYGLIYMAYGLLKYGDNFESIKYFEKALNHIQTNNVQQIPTTTYIIKPLANTYIRIGDNSKAIELLQKSLERTENSIEQTGLLNNLANAHLYNGELDTARQILTKALQIPSPSLSKALLYNTLSTVYHQQQDKEKSILFNRLAIKFFQKSKLKEDTLTWYASALGLQGELHHSISAIETALEILKENFPSSQYRIKAKLQLIQADIYKKQHEIAKAKSCYKDVMHTLSNQGSKYVLDYTYTSALNGLAKVYQFQQQPDSALYYYQWAIENDFRTQQLITSKEDHFKSNVANKKMINDMLELAEHTLRTADASKQILYQQMMWCVELSKGRLLINEINRSSQWESASIGVQKGIQKIRSLYQQVDESENDIERSRLKKQIDQTLLEFELSEKYFETYNFKPEKAKLFKHIADKSADFYSYFIHQNNQITIIAKIGDQYTHKLIQDTSLVNEINNFKRTYFSDSPHNFNKDPHLYRQWAARMTESLLPDINKARANVIVSPDGSLYGLPLDALWDGDFVVQHHNFAYLNSFLLFDFLKPHQNTSTTISLLYRSSYTPPLPNLNFAQTEVENLQQTFQSNKFGPEKQSDTVLQQEFSNSHLIHIAAHTILDDNSAPLIYLKQPISTDQLRFYQIDAPLVFLSACNSGQGKSLPSEGMESIQRVFLSKNVPSVISTYWFANDEAMLTLTANFYEQLYQKKHPAEALAESKRLYLADAESAQANPWYWANINYAGVNNEIGLKKSSSPSLTIGITLSALLLSFFAFRKRGLWFNRPLIKKN